MWTIVTLYWPILAFLFADFAALAVKVSGTTSDIKLTFFGFAEIDLPLKDVVEARSVFVLLAIACLLYALSRDYSIYFRKYLQLDVFWDEAGIERCVAALSRPERESLRIPDNFLAQQGAYYLDLDSELERVLGERVLFAGPKERIHSSGETSFVTEKVDGFQRYHLVESKGELHHVVERRGKTEVAFFTFFEKTSSRYDYFEPKVWSILLGKGTVIRPSFQQILAENLRSKSTIFHHAVIGATRVKVFPYPSMSDTLYLADLGDQGRVPVAYAVYR